MKKGFYTILAAQFLSSLADNALLIAAIALLVSIDAPGWMTPLLKLFFVISYICLAAWVGIFADLLPKGRVMFITNAIKFVGCMMMLFGSHPLLAYAVVGVGAAAYSPAKYGILTELLPPEKLVVANGWMEGLTVVSIILGVVLGGILISPAVAQPIIGFGHFSVVGISTYAEAAIAVIALVYVAASAVNLMIPDTGVRYARHSFKPVESLRNFAGSCVLLWKDPLGQISLAVTSLFWGAGSVLQFIVLKWAESHLGLNLSQGAVLQAVVSVGIAFGAVVAAARVSLKKSLSVLPMGIVMGAMVAAASFISTDTIPWTLRMAGFEVGWAIAAAIVVMVIVGFIAGFFVVPMNALLQHRGYVLMSAGRSIAVQNFNENSSIIIMLACYSLLISVGLSTTETMIIFGLFVAVSMVFIMKRHRDNQRRCDSLHLIGEERRY